MANGRSVCQPGVSRVTRVTSHFLRARQSYILKLSVPLKQAILLCFHLGVMFCMGCPPGCLKPWGNLSIPELCPRKWLLVVFCLGCCSWVCTSMQKGPSRSSEHHGVYTPWLGREEAIVSCLMLSGLRQTGGFQPLASPVCLNISFISQTGQQHTEK